MFDNVLKRLLFIACGDIVTTPCLKTATFFYFLIIFQELTDFNDSVSLLQFVFCISGIGITSIGGV